MESTSQMLVKESTFYYRSRVTLIGFSARISHLMAISLGNCAIYHSASIIAICMWRLFFRANFRRTKWWTMPIAMVKNRTITCQRTTWAPCTFWTRKAMSILWSSSVAVSSTKSRKALAPVVVQAPASSRKCPDQSQSQNDPYHCLTYSLWTSS